VQRCAGALAFVARLRDRRIALNNVRGAWIQDQKTNVENEKTVEYRVNMNVTFVLEK